MRLTAASSLRLLMPRISSGFGTVTVSTRRPRLPVDGHQVGQVVLALRVFGGDAAHGVEQPVERERVDAGVDLADRPLGRAGVLLLDNTCNLLAGCGRCGRSRAGARRRRSRRWRPPRSTCGDRPAFSERFGDSSGTSPDSSTRVPVAPLERGSVVSSAWAVPSCGSWTTNVRPVCRASAASNASA